MLKTGLNNVCCAGIVTSDSGETIFSCGTKLNSIGVRKGGAGGGGGENHYLFGQNLSCHSGNDGLVIRRIY